MFCSRTLKSCTTISSSKQRQRQRKDILSHVRGVPWSWTLVSLFFSYRDQNNTSGESQGRYKQGKQKRYVLFDVLLEVFLLQQGDVNGQCWHHGLRVQNTACDPCNNSLQLAVACHVNIILFQGLLIKSCSSTNKSWSLIECFSFSRCVQLNSHLRWDVEHWPTDNWFTLTKFSRCPPNK